MPTAGIRFNICWKSGEPLECAPPPLPPCLDWALLPEEVPADAGAPLAPSADPPRKREAIRCATIGGNFRSCESAVILSVKGFLLARSVTVTLLLAVSVEMT